MDNLDEKLAFLKTWLGTGSINVFGLPMSGKDTVGIRLAEALGARFLSSGLILREYEKATGEDLTQSGQLTPTDAFYDIVLPYFDREDLRNSALVLSSVGRWSGEENQILATAESSGHEIKAVVLLQVSEADVTNRWETANLLNDRGNRVDDQSKEIFERRISEFKIKTLPVIFHYRELGLLVEVTADKTRDEVFLNLVDQLYHFATTHNH